MVRMRRRSTLYDHPKGSPVSRNTKRLPKTKNFGRNKFTLSLGMLFGRFWAKFPPEAWWHRQSSKCSFSRLTGHHFLSQTQGKVSGDQVFCFGKCLGVSWHRRTLVVLVQGRTAPHSDHWGAASLSDQLMWQMLLFVYDVTRMDS